MPEPFRVISRNNANPSDIIEFDICDHIFIFLVLADSKNSSDSATEHAAEPTSCAAVFEPTILR